MKLTNEQATEIDYAVTARADAIIQNKRKKYSGANDPYKNFRDAAEMAEEETWQAVVSRTMDKFSRIKNMLKQGMTKENWNDLMDNDFPDIVNYTRILAGICKEEWFTNEDIIPSQDGEWVPRGDGYSTWEKHVPYAGGGEDYDGEGTS